MLLWRNLLLLPCQGELAAAYNGLLRQFLLPGAIFKVFHCYFTADNVLVTHDGLEPFPSLEIEVRLTREDSDDSALFAPFEKIEVTSYDV